jgi:hypothetical protein
VQGKENEATQSTHKAKSTDATKHRDQQKNKEKSVRKIMGGQSHVVTLMMSLELWKPVALLRQLHAQVRVGHTHGAMAPQRANMYAQT